MDGRPTWTDCDEAGDYVVPNVLSPRDLVYHTQKECFLTMELMLLVLITCSFCTVLLSGKAY